MVAGWCGTGSRYAKCGPCASLWQRQRPFMSLSPPPPAQTFSYLIQYQAFKEQLKNKWYESPYENLPTLQTNDVGLVGEQFISHICKQGNIPSEIDGIKYKKTNGNIGDGVIKDKSIEIKTAHIGASNSFQHELGEQPWLVDYMIFIDVSPHYIYFTIFPNFTELHYKSSAKCAPYFPSRSICWRNKKGSFKLDTSLYVNEIAILREPSNTMKITSTTKYSHLTDFINRIIV